MCGSSWNRQPLGASMGGSSLPATALIRAESAGMGLPWRPSSRTPRHAGRGQFLATPCAKKSPWRLARAGGQLDGRLPGGGRQRVHRGHEHVHRHRGTKRPTTARPWLQCHSVSDGRGAAGRRTSSSWTTWAARSCASTPTAPSCSRCSRVPTPAITGTAQVVERAGVYVFMNPRGRAVDPVRGVRLACTAGRWGSTLAEFGRTCPTATPADNPDTCF